MGISYDEYLATPVNVIMTDLDLYEVETSVRKKLNKNNMP